LSIKDALNTFPSAGVSLYCRGSTPTQGSGGAIYRQSQDCLASLKAVDMRPKPIHRGRESGKLSKTRKILDGAIKTAKEKGTILASWDLSRFLRSKHFDHKTNRTAVPTEEEIESLRKRAKGVICLATIIPPTATDLHSQAIKRGGRAGRPCQFSTDMIREIFFLYEQHQWADTVAHLDEEFQYKKYSMSRIASKLRITKKQVQLVLDGKQRPKNLFSQF